MINYLVHIDKQLFLFLNGKHNAFFDFVMWWASNKWIWIPFYAFLAFLVFKSFKKSGFYVLIAVGVLITLTDQTSDLIKNTVQRFRPTHTPGIENLVHVLHNYRGGSYGFVSSHATSVFALAFIITFFFRKRYRALPYIMYFWAAMVSYSRIYVGVHFPGDVTCGAILGTILAYIVSLPFRYVKPLKFRY